MAQKAEIKFDPAYIMPNQLATKISELGYESAVLETENLGVGCIELLVRKCRTVLFLNSKKL